MKQSIRCRLNGKEAVVQGGEGGGLLWALREAGLTGAKYGCGSGLCGACTVLVGGNAVRSCMVPLARVAGQPVTTVEGLARGDQLDPLQQAFIEHDAFQCGFCTPGMLMEAHALLRANPRPTPEEVAARLEHHLCRCGAHQRIVDAVVAASRRMAGAA